MPVRGSIPAIVSIRGAVPTITQPVMETGGIAVTETRIRAIVKAKRVTAIEARVRTVVKAGSVTVIGTAVMVTGRVARIAPAVVLIPHIMLLGLD